MNLILATVIISFVIAFLLGCLLGVFKKVFAVHEDEKITKIKEVLPNANCGGCGFAGCASYAEAVAAGTAPLNGCSAGGAAVAKSIAEVLGQTVEAKDYIAVLACQGTCENAVSRGKYVGVNSCASAALAVNGTKLCQYGCIGLGDCEKVCQFGAIKIGDGGIPVIEKTKCTGCTKCIQECPRHLLKKIPSDYKSPLVLCSTRSENKVAVVKDCKVSCIKCKKCERDCEVGAIAVVDGLPLIDEAKCTVCGKCVDGCPRKVLKFM